ncbi:hypothetical protein BH10BAC2_BH10BAC2_13200 [soil metagenome]
MQQTFYSQSVTLSAYRGMLNRFAKTFLLLLFITMVMSFTIDDAYNNNTSQANTGEGEKDSVKGFRNLLGNEVNAINTTVLFELNPRIVPFVNEYVRKQTSNLEKMRSWGQPYFMISDKILSANTIPAELKYLSVVESNLQIGVVSGAGAAGPWQLMPNEARRFGLIVTSRYDERTNFYKSTEAAAKLLKELYSEYNDWLLVIAAYNCGKGGLNRAISKSGSRNFYDLQMYLPEETRNHVKKYIATHYFFEGGGGWTTITAKETLEKKEHLTYLKIRMETIADEANSAMFDITGKYNSTVVAKVLLIDINQFNRLNPYFDKELSEGKPYTIRLPQDKMDIFKAKRQQILYESVQLFLSEPPSATITTAVVITK